MAVAVLSEIAPALSLSPPKPSKRLAYGALVATIAASVFVILVNQSCLRQATDPGLVQFCRIFSLLSIFGCIGVLYVALTAVRASWKSDALVNSGLVLDARASSEKARQEAHVALGLCAALLLIVSIAGIVTMSNGTVQKTFLKFDLMWMSLGDVAKAFLVNVFMALVAQVFIMVFGLALAVARMLPGRAGAPIRFLAIGYIDLFRAVPAIIVIYIIGFGLPLSKIPYVSQLPPVVFAIIALTATYSAYVAETFRSGIESIHPSQWSAARSLGLSYAETLRYVILPQAIRNVIPPLLSSFIGLQKDTALVNIIGTMDAFNQAKYYANISFNLSSVTVVAILFFIFTIPQTRLVDHLLASRSRKG